MQHAATQSRENGLYMRELHPTAIPCNARWITRNERGKRFESARRLSRFGVDKPISLHKAVHISVTLRDAKGWHAHCSDGSSDQYS